MQVAERYPSQGVTVPPSLAPAAATRSGVPLPLGASEIDGGVNFALFGRNATRVQLQLFADVTASEPRRILELDPICNRTGDIWHIWVEGIAPGQLYGYRIEGSDGPESGPCFEFDTLLLDPYAAAIKRQPSAAGAAMCVVTCADFDWRDDHPPRHSWENTVIYETHVRGFTAHPSSKVRCPGTYRGLVEKIPYLTELGITAVELLPVQEFNAHASASEPGKIRSPVNYWGYDPVGLFAPNGAYSAAGDSGQQVLEFKEMVRELHAAGIEVILDVVLDHAAMSVEQDATLCWYGFDNPALGILRRWVADMHVDGFRIELPAVVGHDAAGGVLNNLPLLERIAEDPILREVKLIGEGWRAAGAYELETFSERRWAEWNFRYRDDVRRFWRGDEGMLGAFASRVCGSEDLYARSGKGPECGINLVTSHDGFTLNDVVSFQRKHNIENGLGNCDGVEENYSANYGAEGPTADSDIEAIRTRQAKNFLLTLFVSRGVPMLLGGDEFRRTQRGNNNAFCQDNDTSWCDWRFLGRYPDLHDFVVKMTRLRKHFPVLSRGHFYSTHGISWFAAKGGVPAWSDRCCKSVGCLVHDGHDALYLMFNAEEKAVSFTVPPAPGGRRWRLAVDTHRDPPAAAHDGMAGAIVERDQPYSLGARSSAVLVAACVTTGGSNPEIDCCAGAMVGADPDAAYAAAILWYQGYPDSPK